MKKNISKPARPSKASACREGKLTPTEGPIDMYEKILKPAVQNLVQEVAWSISLDCQGRVLSVDEIGRGPVDRVEVSPREVFRPAIEVAATYVVIAHFHPSDDVRPSDDDKGLTRRVIAAGNIVGIPCIDHLVVGKSGFTALSTKMPEFTYPEIYGLDAMPDAKPDLKADVAKPY